METLPFARKAPANSSWGFGGIKLSDDVPKNQFVERPTQMMKEPQNFIEDHTYDEYMPAVLLNSLKKDKKPFTYTPGRVDLSEVLNAKLQKRLTKKKEKVRSPQPVIEDPTKQVLVMPTYNSPLNMYSMENALEALEVQAEYTLAHKSPNMENSFMTLPRNFKYETKDFEPKNVTQSKAFRVLQIITDTEEEEEQEELQPKPKVHQVPQENEVKFSGLRDNKGIPSKFFHNLQKITETDGNNPYQSKSEHNAAFENEYRFHGMRNNNAIPSKLFHNLQRITNTNQVDYNNQVNRNSPQLHNSSISPVHSVPKFPKYTNNCAMENHNANPILKRPAAFLPSKPPTRSETKYYNPGKIQNSSYKPIRPFEGTDF